jgi:hypothetical protein
MPKMERIKSIKVGPGLGSGKKSELDAAVKRLRESSEDPSVKRLAKKFEKRMKAKGMQSIDRKMKRISK